jgi:hypothetical protein
VESVVNHSNKKEKEKIPCWKYLQLSITVGSIHSNFPHNQILRFWILKWSPMHTTGTGKLGISRSWNGKYWWTRTRTDWRKWEMYQIPTKSKRDCTQIHFLVKIMNGFKPNNTRHVLYFKKTDYTTPKKGQILHALQLLW